MNIKHITSYIEYLKNECALEISIHFSSDAFASLPHKLFSELLPYNCHNNPYCLAIKAQSHKLCIHSQRNLRESCVRDVGLCRTCFAGVSEYIYPVCNRDAVIGFVAVSGYIGANSKKELSSYLRSEPIPTELCDSVVPPLSVMLEKLFSENGVAASDEYSRILQFLSEYHTGITVSSLAKHFNRSVSHISHLFKRKSGMSVSEYCNDLKLIDASRLLVGTDMSVTQIALDSGFSDVSYFISLFKKKFGTTPLQYRKNNHSEITQKSL